MKAICVALAVAAVLLLPVSIFAMTPLTEKELSTITGASQGTASAGVSVKDIAVPTALLKNSVNLNQTSASGTPGASVISRTSGVSIYFDVTIYLHFDVIAWGDADGLGTAEASKAGYAGLSQFNINRLRMKTRN